MYFKQIIDEIGDSLNDTCAKWAGDNSGRVIEAVNEFMFLELLPLLDWWFLDREYTLSTVAEYTIGTVSTTQGSTTITGSGTTFTSTMVGYRIFVEGGVRSYKITGYSSATSITIESAFEEVSLTGASYHICKDRYNLPRYLDDPTKISKVSARWNNYALNQLSKQDMDSMLASKAQVDDPKYYTIGLRERTTYTTGTVSGTSGTSILTGASTAWNSSSIEAFDYIAVGDQVFTVKSVDSDTQITIYESIVATINASTSYTATLDRYKIDLYPLPKNIRGYTITLSQLQPKLVNAYDIPLIPDNWHYVLVKGGRVRMMLHNQDQNYQFEKAELNEVLKRMISANNREKDRLETFSTGYSNSNW